MRNRGLLIGALACLIVVLAIGTFAYAMHARTQPQPTSYLGLKSRVALVCPGPTYSTTGEGIPGIRPRNDCTPAFTQQDMRDYLAQGIPLGHVDVIGRPTVAQVVFVTVRNLGQATGNSGWLSSYPGDMVVCYVVLHGTFRVSGPTGAGTSHTFSTASILFDAHTGNELAVGTPAELS